MRDTLAEASLMGPLDGREPLDVLLLPCREFTTLSVVMSVDLTCNTGISERLGTAADEPA